VRCLSVNIIHQFSEICQKPVRQSPHLGHTIRKVGKLPAFPVFGIDRSRAHSGDQLKHFISRQWFDNCLSQKRALREYRINNMLISTQTRRQPVFVYISQ
jgi:hypothetical protein